MDAGPHLGITNCTSICDFASKSAYAALEHRTTWLHTFYLCQSKQVVESVVFPPWAVQARSKSRAMQNGPEANFHGKHSRNHNLGSGREPELLIKTNRNSTF